MRIAKRRDNLRIDDNRVVHDQVGNQPQLGFVNLGRFKLKNVGRPFEIFAVSTDGLAVPAADLLLGKGERFASLPSKNVFASRIWLNSSGITGCGIGIQGSSIRRRATDTTAGTRNANTGLRLPRGALPAGAGPRGHGSAAPGLTGQHPARTAIGVLFALHRALPRRARGRSAPQ